MDARLAIACAHCGSPVSGTTDPTVASYCCAGCRTAADVVRACGLGDFHRMRASLGPVAPVSLADRPIEDDAAFTRNVVMRTDGLAAIDWHVEGIRCAACVWLLERLPWLDPGVRSARIDLSSACLMIVFDPARTSAAQQATLARRLGYTLRPYATSESVDARRRERRLLMLRFAVALGATFASMHLGLNVTAGDVAGDMDAGTRRFFALGSFTAAIPALTWSAAPFWRGALASIRAARWTLDATIACMLSLGLGAGALAAVSGGSIYADAVAMFVALLLGSRLILAYALDQSARAGAATDGVLPGAARRISDGAERMVPSEALCVGDRVRVMIGEPVPCDGVVENDGWIEAAVLTGESRAIAVAPGDTVLAGSRSRAELTVRCTSAGQATRIAQLLTRARLAAQRPRVETAVDRLQAWFAPTVLLLSVTTAAFWWHAGARVAIDQALAMALVCCPCALGLAGPLVRAIVIAGAARRGLLISDPDAFDRMRAARHVVLDKTGTLTAGAVGVTEWTWISDAYREQIANAVFTAESRSRHPTAAAICAFLQARGATTIAIEDWREIPGRGVECRFDGRLLRVGSANFTGAGGIGVSCDDRPVAHLLIDDPPLPDARALIARLRAMRLSPSICSGDTASAVAATAAIVGVDVALAACSPERKKDYVAGLVSDNGAIMIGDGVNDAPALSASSFGIGIRGGLEPCLACCGAFAARGGLAGAVDLIEASHAAHRAERWCLITSLIYNALGIAAVAAGLIGPLVCAAVMPLSSATVVLLAWRLSPWRPSVGPPSEGFSQPYRA